MSADHDSTKLEAALRRLGGPVTPDPSLEDRVLADLAAHHHLRPVRRRHVARTVLAAAAGVLIFAAGVWFGRTRPTVPEGPHYALLLYDGPDYAEPTPDEMPAVVERYGRWAASLRDDRSLVSAEKLGANVGVVPADGTEPIAPLGFFVVAAPDDDAAAAIAAASPHVARGGRVLVVRVDPT